MFKENKYTKWYWFIVNRAKQSIRHKKDGNYYESHHIIPKCMGGSEEVLLTGKEHFICHLLLCRMTTGHNKHKMINALIKMAFAKSSGQKRYTAHSYSLVKKLIAEKNSEMFKGKPKSEQAKKNMKGRSGTWKRTESYCKAMSERQKGKFVGESNPFFGKKHTKESMDKRTQTRRNRGIKNIPWSKGMTWYHDGTKRVWKEKIDA